MRRCEIWCLALAPAKVSPQRNPRCSTGTRVRPVVGTGLELPTSLAFLGANDFLVLEKNTGKVKRVTNGVVQATDVLDLDVNFGSERGLLGIALHPNFASNKEVYLYWTESTTGGDSVVLSDTPLLGNRVDRFTWDGATLTHDANIILLRAIQEDADQPARGNHDGGVIAFGADGKLYVFFGDVGRRGHLQNLPCGPTANCPGPTVQDDQFGGPEPDDAHLSGVVLRLNDDGSAPADNPFFAARRVGRRPGRGQHPEGLHLRPPQQLRHGARSLLRRLLAAGERRRFVQRAQSSGGRPERRLDPDLRPGVAHRAVQGDRDHVRRDAAAADPLAADQHRRHAAGGAGAALRAARVANTAIPSSRGSGRSRPAAWASCPARRSARSSRAICSWAPRRRCCAAGTCSTST